MQRLCLLCAVLCLAAGTWLLVRPLLDQRAPGGAAGDPVPASKPAPSGAAPLPGEAAAVAPLVSGSLDARADDVGSAKATAGIGVLVLPNGKKVRALNGVTTEVRLLWPAETPYSPITGVTRTQGIDWYVHADGSRSTTQMVYRSDLGRKTAMSMVANPRPALPLQPDRDAEAEDKHTHKSDG